MRIGELEKKLETEKKRFVASKSNVHKLRMKIAKMKCPYKIGDAIKIQEDGIVYEVKVKFLDYAIRFQEVRGPKPGFETTWMVNGNKPIKRGPKIGLPISTTGFSKTKNGIHINKKNSTKEMLDRLAETSETIISQWGF